LGENLVSRFYLGKRPKFMSQDVTP